MDDKTYYVRISSRFQSETDWISVDPILLQGEIAIVTCKSDIPNKLPEIRIKSGDGIHKYSELPFISANALDVYNWAKQKNKPLYYADEIIDLDKSIRNQLGDHNHDMDNIIGLTNFVNERINNHTHSIDDIIGLREELNKKVESNDDPSLDNGDDSSNNGGSSDEGNESDGSQNDTIVEKTNVIANPNDGLYANQDGSTITIGINNKTTFILDGGDSSQFQA